MRETVINQFWEILGYILALDSQAFTFVTTFADSEKISIILVLVAGLSEAIAQIIVLAINRVQPVRFIFSLLINAVLYTFGYLFLVFSTWLITFIPGTVDVHLGILATIIGASYAPLLFSFLGAMPYLGEPILSLLSGWHLLAMVVGIATVTNLSLVKALSYVILGWIVLEVLKNTIGQPLANIGRWVANTTAGVNLTTNRRDFLAIIRNGLKQPSNPVETTQVTSNNSLTTTPIIHRTSKTILGLLGIAVVSLLVVFWLNPLYEWLFAGFNQSLGKFGLIVNLIWIGLIALVIAGLLAPLETLGWWAGWYGDEINTTINVEEVCNPGVKQDSISRYVVYLDGIGKSSVEYLPDVKRFLETLTPHLPQDVVLIRGIMPYSVINKPLDENRPLAWLWRLIDSSRNRNPASLLGLLVNLRNVLIVALSADKRYGPLYNQGIAQVIYNSLVKYGYQLGSNIPITLIGYSGGGQISSAATTFLKSALKAPIDIISLGGVISGNCDVLQLEHLYHLVGDKDDVEKLGPIMFPGRWKIFFLSFWNRAKRRGKISVISLGAVGHQVPGGLMDPLQYLPDGRSFLQQTIDFIISILQGKLLTNDNQITSKISNYQLYQKAAFNHPEYYPLNQSVSRELYQPIAPWMGRLILPTLEARQRVKGAFLEVYNTEVGYEHLLGQVVNLRWSNDEDLQTLIQAVTKDVHFSAEAEYTSKYEGLIHPTRLNHWQQVNPWESLAGSRPYDDVVVMLPESVVVKEDNLYIDSQPIEITGRFYGLVKFVACVNQPDLWRVVHLKNGMAEVVSMPEVVADQNGCFPSTSKDIDKSPLNETGWYIYGAPDAAGRFVVESLAPRVLLRLQPEKIIWGKKPAYEYIRKNTWENIEAKKGQISSVLLNSEVNDWHEGDRALLLHVYGGIGGQKKEPAAASPIFFGHFAYGIATVIRDPLADELRFDINYYQVYSHNSDGLIAGTLHWSKYMGDRQFGWMGTRPVADILVKLDPYTGYYNIDGEPRSPLNLMIRQLEAMTARYRIGDGTGGTYVGPANNCAQDSNQALFASIRQFESMVKANQDLLRIWSEMSPRQGQRFKQLIRLKQELKEKIQPIGSVRSDWQENQYNLGLTLEDEPMRNLIMGIASWRTMLPRLASDTIVEIFLKHDAYVWVLRTNQVGGYDPDIEPIAPITF